MRHSRLFWLLSGLYVGVFGLYSLFTFALTDPNLTYLSWAPYWRFQWWMWATFFHNADLLSNTYLGLILCIFAIYLLLCGLVLRQTSANSAKINNGNYIPTPILFWSVVSIISVMLILSNNSLSHDLFNYLFNAKMVAVYHADPHVRTALEYAASDDWVRFMHNTHTSAPYGYGWTIWSLIPFVAGLQKFTLTWLMFKIWSGVSLVFLVWAVNQLSLQLWQKRLSLASAVLLFANPLLLIEVLSNGHNDLWMMAPAIWSLTLLLQSQKVKKGVGRLVIFSILALAFSISMKLVTVVLIPLWLIIWSTAFIKSLPFGKKVAGFFHNNLALIASLFLFVPLFTAQSQRFLPWYLIWILVWLPLIKGHNWWKRSIITLSLFCLLRYYPFLSVGEFTPEVIWQQQLTTWVPLGVWVGGEIIFAIICQTLKSSQNKAK